MSDYNLRRYEFKFKGSLFPLIFLTILLIGVITTDLFSLEQARIYSILIIGSIIFGFILHFITNLNDVKYIEYPFEQNSFQGTFFFWLGIILVPIFTVFTTIILKAQSFEVIKPFVIFSSAGTPSQLGTTLSIINIQLNSFWSYFYTTWVPAIAETWVYNIILILVGVLLFRALNEFLWKDAISEKNLKTYSFLFALAFVAILFAASHLLNNTYTNPLFFAISILFITLMNISLYYANFTFSFAVGFHFANNFLSNWKGNLEGSLTPWGLGLTAFLLLTLVYVVINFPKKSKELFKVYASGL